MAGTRLSEPGLAFLKCAFAPPDFNVDPGQGIPDLYQGRTFVRKNNTTFNTTFAAGKTTWIVVLPTPEIAFWRCETDLGVLPTGSDTFTGSTFPGASSVIPVAVPSANVSAFRYASMAFGIYPTSNMMQYGGSITVWKAGVRMSDSSYSRTIATIPATAIPMVTPAIAGLESTQFVGRDNYATGFNNGMFATSAASDADFPWHPVLEHGPRLPVTGVTTSQAGMPWSMAPDPTYSCPIIGCEGMDGIFIRIDTPVGAVNAAVIKAWACIEYKPSSLGVYDNMGGLSPPHDAAALEAYRAIAKNLPPAVRALDNAALWDRIKEMFGGALGLGMGVARAASYVPGPIGQVGGHVVGLAELFSRLGM